MLSPFELIKKGSASIINQGKQGLDRLIPDVKKQADGNFRATKTGIAKNTILGTIGDTSKLPKEVFQGTARGLATIGQGAKSIISSGATGFKKEISSKVPNSGSGLERFLYGTDKSFSVSTEGQPLADIFGAKEGTRSGKILAPVLGTMMPLLDALPGGRGARTAFQKTAPDILQRIVRSEDAGLINRFLKSIGVADDVAERTAFDLSKTTDRKVVEATLKNTPTLNVPPKKAPLSQALGNTNDVSKVELESVYKNTGNSKVEGFSRADEELSNLLTQMETSTAGQRITTSEGVKGVSSTFPDWVPSHLRKQDLFRKVMPDINNIQYPKGKAQAELYDTILQQLDTQLGIDTSKIRNNIKQNGKNTVPEVVDSSIARSGSGDAAGAVNPTRVAPPASNTMGTGEVRSLEKMADQDRFSRVPENPNAPKAPDFIPKKPPTPLKEKVGWFDATKSPEEVFKQMGHEELYTTLRRAKENLAVELPKNIDKITELAKGISPESNTKIFRYLDGEAVDLTVKEKTAADAARKIFNDFADRMGLKEDDRVSNYVTHLFDDEVMKMEFPEEIAKMIDDKIPGSVYNPFLQKRLGADGYKQDFVAALDAYTKRATRKIHMDPALEKLAEVGSTAEKTQAAFMKSIGDHINMRPNFIDEGGDIAFKKMFGYRAGQRPVADISRTLRQWFFRGTLGGNLVAPIVNLSQAKNTYTEIGGKYLAIGYREVAQKGVKELEDLGILGDNFVTDRSLSATKKFWQKTDKGLFYLFDKAERLNRGSAYYGGKAKALAAGKTEAEAIEFGKKIVRDTQFQYGALDTPLILQGDTNKLLTQYMSYPIKQLEFIAKMGKGLGKKGERVDSAQKLARFTLATVAEVYVLSKLFGRPGFEWNEDVSIKDNLAKNSKVLFDGLNPLDRFGFGPSLGFAWETGKAALDMPDKYGRDRDTEQKLKDIGNSIIPMIPGGAQIKRSVVGAKAVKEKGSFTKDGKKQYDVGGTPLRNIQAILFGKGSSPDAQAYYDKISGNAPKTEVEKQEAKNKERKVEEKEEVSKIIKEIETLVSAGDVEGARTKVLTLTPEQKEYITQIKSSEKTAATRERTNSMKDTAVALRKLQEAGSEDEARKLILDLNEEDRKALLSAYKQLYQ